MCSSLLAMNRVHEISDMIKSQDSQHLYRTFCEYEGSASGTVPIDECHLYDCEAGFGD